MKRGSNPAKVRQWRERLLRFQQSGQTVAEFCHKERVSKASLYRWRKNLVGRVASNRSRMPSADPCRKAGKSRRSTTPKERTVSLFKPVQVKTGPQAAACLTVQLPGGVQLAVNDHLPVAEMVLVKLLEHAVAKREGHIC
jgi:hypothetical protein